MKQLEQIKGHWFRRAIRCACGEDALVPDEAIGPEQAVREAEHEGRLLRVIVGLWICWHRHRQEHGEWPVVTVFARETRGGQSNLSRELKNKAREEARAVGYGVIEAVMPDWADCANLIYTRNVLLKQEKRERRRRWNGDAHSRSNAWQKQRLCVDQEIEEAANSLRADNIKRTLRESRRDGISYHLGLLQRHVEQQRIEFINSLRSDNIKRTFRTSPASRVRYDPLLVQFYLEPLSPEGNAEGPEPILPNSD